MNALRLVKTKSHTPAGEYRPTDVDAAKAAADFLVVDVSGRGAVIVWRNGERERVTDRRLEALQQAHTWAPDF